MRWASVLVLAFLLALGACSSEPTELIAGTDGQTAPEEPSNVPEEPSETSIPTTTAPPKPPDTDEAVTTTAPAVDTTIAPPIDADTTTTAAPEPPTDLGGRADVLGEASSGTGFWAVIRPEEINPDDECTGGQLAFGANGEILHVYEEFEFNGGVRLFNGPRGQDTFVFNCEETVDRIAYAGSAVLPESGWPVVLDVAMSDVWFAFTSGFDWYGDVFGGTGSHPDGYDALFVIEPNEIELVALDSLLGERIPVDQDIGVSIVVPNGWTIDASAPGHLVESPTSNSRVHVWSVDGLADAPPAEGDQLLSSTPVDRALWGAPAENGMSVVATFETTSWFFSTPELGARVVTHVPRCDDTVVIEMFSDPSDGGVDADVPWLAESLLQVRDTTCDN